MENIDPNTVRAATWALQWIVVFITALTVFIGVLLLRLRLSPVTRAYLLPMFVLTLHTLAFYMFAMFHLLTPVWGNFHSVLLRLHAALFVFGVIVVHTRRQIAGRESIRRLPDG